MRIALAGVVHETNTYCKDLTPASDFYLRRGEKLLRLRDTETSAGGAIKACEELQLTLVPVMVAMAPPSGTIERGAFEAFKSEILQGLAAAMPLDGVMLELHGAGVVEGIFDLEGDLAQAVRHLVGEAVPVVATFDLHGNITQAMADAVDGVFACHQYPHIDFHERAEEAIHLIKRIHDEHVRPVCHVEQLPMLAPTTTTFEGIGKDMLAAVLAAEDDPDVIDVSWFHGFPYTDIPDVGASVVVTTTGNRERAHSVARKVASTIWNHREDFQPEILSARKVIEKAQSLDSYPIVINETSDNCGGGSPGDGTHLLQAMLDAKLEKACFGFIVDPEVAQQAQDAGTGATINISLGGKYDNLHGEPIESPAYVKALHDGRLTMLAMMKGSPINYGTMARLVIHDMDVIVASRRMQTLDIGPFAALGIDVTDYQYVALKSSNHFRAGFTHLAGTIITADTPGLTTHNIQVFDRQHANRAMWPIDPSASY